MDSFWLIVFAISGVGFGFGYLFMRKDRHQRHAFADAFADNPEFQVVQRGGLLDYPRIRSKHGRPVDCGPSTTGGKHPTLLWDVVVSQVALGQLSSMTLSLEGTLGQLREAVGISDVHVGDAEFDETYTLRGSSPDHIRRAFSDPDVREAVAEVFASRVWSCSLTSGGDLCVKFVRNSDYDVVEFGARVEATIRLAAALDAAPL